MKTTLGRVLAGAMILMVSVALAAEEPFDYFRNSWNVIGLKDYQDGTRITPGNALRLANGAEARIRFGKQLTPLSRKQTKTLLDGWLPVVLLSAEDGPVRYEFTLWATPLPTVKNWQAAYDWPVEGENFLNWIAVKATNTGQARAEAQVAVERSGGPRPVTEMAVWSIAPARSAEGVFRIPFAPVANPAQFAAEDPKLWLDRTVQFWRGLLDRAARIEVPCRKATEALRAAHVCQLLANDHGVLKGGEGFYDEFYIRDGGYQIMELEEAGLWDAARKAAEHYLTCQRPDGRFESQKDQYDANGQAVWVLWQYWKITGDRSWLEKVYPQMVRAVQWTALARRQAAKDSPFAGVLPNAPADGEFLWDGKHHIVGYDIWNLRAVLLTADAARALGKTSDAAAFEKEAREYREAFDAAWKRTGVPHFPPSWEKDGTHWGNTETLWPTELFARDDPRVAAMIDHARKTHGGGFIEGTIQWLGTKGAIHPYMSAYTTMASLVRGDHDQVVEDFYWYLLHSTAAHAFPEGIFYKRRFAWSDTIPHVTGAANYALLLRHMLVHEAGDELHLLAGAPDGWLADGKEIRVENAPTHFGPMSLRTRGTAKGVEVQWSAPSRTPPKRVVLHLPKSRPLSATLPGVEIATRPDQKKPWDFATVVALYQQEAPKPKPIPGLVELPLATPLPAAHCRMLDLAPVANTDPFVAPFGVPKPGKLLFTGLRPGEQTVAGVRFSLLDPAKNQGRALVVLHSPHAPKDRTWPSEVQIPVNQQGKRLYFLGNIHGWSPSDEGSGDWGAIAEYVIHYADGQKAVVPLIPGRTTDDWCSAPEAEEVYLGLKGDPWHLNVLGVALRPVPVEKIVFRDLGTAAAPVLAAVTLEQ
ncbi:MAG: hypothetical protein NUV77_09025 [Thermoguttaceae bacterium]|jgi:hypothetical protein|nr:hypothetical protein [Thermoguttaceae bacterium]